MASTSAQGHFYASARPVAHARSCGKRDIDQEEPDTACPRSDVECIPNGLHYRSDGKV